MEKLDDDDGATLVPQTFFSPIHSPFSQAALGFSEVSQRSAYHPELTRVNNKLSGWEQSLLSGLVKQEVPN